MGRAAEHNGVLPWGWSPAAGEGHPVWSSRCSASISSPPAADTSPAPGPKFS